MNKKINVILNIIICFLLASTVFSISAKQSNSKIQTETSCHIQIETLDAKIIASNLKYDGFDILQDTITQNSFELIVTPQELKNLEEQGYNAKILDYGKPYLELQKELYSQLTMVPPGYLGLQEIYDEMDNFESSYSSICTVVDLTVKYDMPATYDDRHIYAMKISDNVEEEEGEPTFLMVSCHHAREIVTPVIALYSIDQFTSNYASDPQIKSLVDEYEIWIVPVWNPDGYDYVMNVDNMWRKNRHYFSQYNSYGVDLNRNYPFGWDSGCSGSTDPFSETYKGPSAASEAETQTMMAFSNDRHFTKVIDYHSYAREVLYSYCCHSHPFSSFLEDEAIIISNAAGYYGSVRAPSAEGENYEWQLFTNGTYANLMETHTSFQPDYNSAVAEAVQVWPSTITILERPISISGYVRDSRTNQPIIADIELDGITFPNGEEFRSEGSFGRYHLFLPAGTYSVVFSAPFYESQSHTITVTSDSAEILNIDLDLINEEPNAPSIDGPTSGTPGNEYLFKFQATDPDDDNIFYYIDWDDDTCEEWIGPYKSGQLITVNHIWEEEGTYIVKAKVKDVFDDESDWGTLEVVMPVNKQVFSYPLLKILFDRFPNIFPILRYILEF